MTKFKRCPCGQIPLSLGLNFDHDKPKWGRVVGNCCGEWEIEYRNQYLSHDSPEAMEKAIEAWNGAKRWDDETST